IIDELVDIVSKNGNMLLNVPPKADGTLDAETEGILVDIGKWFEVNGEAIYGTRPWLEYGEGNLRFTRKGPVLYVIALEWPDTNILTVPSSALGEKAGLASEVSLLGHEGKLQSRRDEKGLAITLPERKPCEHAWCLRVVLDQPTR
ncbi:MAG: alpha-L-fucosidase, partial [Planctomycetota bacterium]